MKNLKVNTDFFKKHKKLKLLVGGLVLGSVVVSGVHLNQTMNPKEEEIQKIPVNIVYENLEYQKEEKNAVPIISSDGVMWAIGATTYDKPVMIPVNKDYEIGVYEFGSDNTMFFHAAENPIDVYVDFKERTIEVEGATNVKSRK